MSPEDIVNRAADQIRARASVTSINPSDGSNLANIASRNYQPIVDNVSRSAHWNCLRFQAAIPLLKARPGTPENPNGAIFPSPPVPWLYEYGWPQVPFCLKARWIVPMVPQQTVSPPLTTGNIETLTWVNPNYAVPFQVAKDVDANGNLQNVILTNAPGAIMVYTARVNDPTLWDPMFQDAVVMTLAAWLCEPITGSTQLREAAVRSAQALILGARISDGNEGTTTSDHIPDWIRVRAAYPAGLLGNTIAAFDAIGFPGGSIF